MITLSASKVEDVPFLYEVYRSTRMEEVSAWGWNDDELDLFLRMQFDLQQRSYALQYPHAKHCVVWRSGERVGRMTLHVTAREIELIDISLLPEHRNTGIGKQLMLSLQETATACEKPVKLHVRRSSPALFFYEKLGFRIIEVDDIYAAMEWDVQ